MPECIRKIDALLDGLDQDRSYRIYILSDTTSQPVECMTRTDFRLSPAQIKCLTWLLVIRNPTRIMFQSREGNPCIDSIETTRQSRESASIEFSSPIDFVSIPGGSRRENGTRRRSLRNSSLVSSGRRTLSRETDGPSKSQRSQSTPDARVRKR